MKYDECRNRLQERSASLKCRELLAILKRLGFKVRDGARGGHKMYAHPYLNEFHGGDFNCGHSSGDDVRPKYVKGILKVVEEFEDELREFLDG